MLNRVFRIITILLIPCLLLSGLEAVAAYPLPARTENASPTTQEALALPAPSFRPMTPPGEKPSGSVTAAEFLAKYRAPKAPATPPVEKVFDPFIGCFYKARSWSTTHFRIALPSVFAKILQSETSVWMKDKIPEGQGFIQLSPNENSKFKEKISIRDYTSVTSRQLTIPKKIVDQIPGFRNDPFVIIGTEYEMEVWPHANWLAYNEQNLAPDILGTFAGRKIPLTQKQLATNFRLHNIPLTVIRHLGLSSITEPLILEPRPMEKSYRLVPLAVWIYQIRRKEPRDPAARGKFLRLAFSHAFMVQILPGQRDLTIPKDARRMVPLQLLDRIEFLAAGPRRVDLRILSAA